jgi:hypothetical protein
MWRQLTRDDLTAKLADDEANAFSKRAWAIDPVPPLLEMTADWVRDACRSNGNVRLSPEEHSIPAGCVTFAMDYAVVDLLKRMSLPVNEDRRKAREEALKYFDKIATGRVNPESWGAAETAQSGGPAVELVSTYPDRVGHMEGL